MTIYCTCSCKISQHAGYSVTASGTDFGQCAGRYCKCEKFEFGSEAEDAPPIATAETAETCEQLDAEGGMQCEHPKGHWGYHVFTIPVSAKSSSDAAYIAVLDKLEKNGIQPQWKKLFLSLYEENRQIKLEDVLEAAAKLGVTCKPLNAEEQAVVPQPIGPIKQLHQSDDEDPGHCHYCGKNSLYWGEAEQCNAKMVALEAQRKKIFESSYALSPNNPAVIEMLRKQAKSLLQFSNIVPVPSTVKVTVDAKDPTRYHIEFSATWMQDDGRCVHGKSLTDEQGCKECGEAEDI